MHRNMQWRYIKTRHFAIYCFDSHNKEWPSPQTALTRWSFQWRHKFLCAVLLIIYINFKITAYLLTCKATLWASGLCIQNRVDTVETARGELVVVPLVAGRCAGKHDEVPIFTTRSAQLGIMLSTRPSEVKTRIIILISIGYTQTIQWNLFITNRRITKFQ